MPHPEITSCEELHKAAAYGPVIVKFAAAWCRPCKAFAPVFDELSAQLLGVESVTVDVDKADDALIGEFAIKGIPAVWYIEGEMAKPIEILSVPQMVAQVGINTASMA